MECKFLADPDDTLKCSICHEVARDPKQEEACGKLFCSLCIVKWKEYSCPTCRALNPRYFLDRRSYREIQALAVFCSHEKYGCDWKGTVATLEKHKAQCDYAKVTCPNGCTKTGHLLRKDLRYHMKNNCPERKYTCRHCGKVSTYKDITEVHDVLCEKKIVKCSNIGCNMRMKRGQVASHIRESCDYTEVYCKYASIGCDRSDMRMEMSNHEEDSKFHLSIALNKIAKLSETALSGPVKKESITFKLTEFSKKNKSKSCHYFQPFFTSPSGYMMSFSVDPNGEGSRKGTHLSVFFEILHGPYDSRLQWPLKAVFTVELLNQEADSSHYTKTIEFTGDGDHCMPGCINGWGYPEFIALSALPFPAVMNARCSPARSSPAQSLPERNKIRYAPVPPFVPIGRVQSSHSILSARSCSTVSPTQYLKDDTLYFRVTSKIPSHKPWLDHTHE